MHLKDRDHHARKHSLGQRCLAAANRTTLQRYYFIESR